MMSTSKVIIAGAAIALVALSHQANASRRPFTWKPHPIVHDTDETEQLTVHGKVGGGGGRGMHWEVGLSHKFEDDEAEQGLRQPILQPHFPWMDDIFPGGKPSRNRFTKSNGSVLEEEEEEEVAEQGFRPPRLPPRFPLLDEALGRSGSSTKRKSRLFEEEEEFDLFSDEEGTNYQDNVVALIDEFIHAGLIPAPTHGSTTDTIKQASGLIDKLIQQGILDPKKLKMGGGLKLDLNHDAKWDWNFQHTFDQDEDNEQFVFAPNNEKKKPIACCFDKQPKPKKF